MFKEIAHYWDLLYMLTLRDIRIRYKQAAMGFVWAIFMPVVAVGAGILIKKAMAVVSGEYIEMIDVISISVKVVPWTFFISALQFAVQSLVGNSQLVTKIYFPKEVLPLAAINACFFDFLVAAVVLVFLLAIFHIGISLHILWLPLLVILMCLFTAGVGLMLAAANLFFRDVKYVVQVILRFGIFFTPVLYDAKSLGNWAPFVLINPIGSILECMNDVVVLKTAPQWGWMLYSTLASVLIFLWGLKTFQNKQQLFAENI